MGGYCESLAPSIKICSSVRPNENIFFDNAIKFSFMIR